MSFAELTSKLPQGLVVSNKEPYDGEPIEGNVLDEIKSEKELVKLWNLTKERPSIAKLMNLVSEMDEYEISKVCQIARIIQGKGYEKD